MADFAELLAQARLPETTVSLCLRGDLAAEFQDLDRQLQDAPLTAPNLGERSPRTVIAERMQDLRAQMSDAEIIIRMRALKALDWSTFAATRPTERAEDEPEDAFRLRWFGWVAELVSRCAIDPVLTVEEVGKLVDHLSGRQWDDLSNAAWNLNEQRVQIPFSAAASALTHKDEPS